MAAILHALQGILTIVIMIATGFYLSRKGWFSESFSSAVAQLVTKVCLPTYMIVNLTVNFSHDQLKKVFLMSCCIIWSILRCSGS